MRFSSLVSLGAALFCFALPPVLAQNLPPCALQCFQNALMNPSVNTDACAPTDTLCICSSAPVNAAIQGCVATTCTVKETLVAVNATSTMCGAPIRDRTNVLLLVSAISGGLAVLCVLVRVAVAVSARNFWWDDGFAVGAWVLSLPLWVLQVVTPGLGFGKDTWTVSPENIIKVLQMIYASQVAYFLSSGLTKLTFLFFYLRIFPAKSLRKAVFVFVGITVGYALAFDVTMIFACKPISAVWTGWMKESVPDYCINQNTFYYVAAAFNISIDIAILILPIPELYRLKLSLKKKILLMSIFSVGGVTIVVSCIRLKYLAQYATSQNPLYDNLNPGIYSVLETNVGIICICMPSFRRVLVALAPKCFGSTHEDSKYKNYDDTPNARFSTGKRSNPKFKKSTLGGSLFDTHITKTMDTRVESTHSDDEVQLVDLQKSGKAVPPSTRSADGSMRHVDRYNGI